MQKRSETATAMMSAGFNCAQSVLCVFCEDTGLERETALKLATGFGAGLARRQEVCGAVTGAVMAIGLRHGLDNAENNEAKERTYRLTRELMDRFVAEFGSFWCRKLLDGCDLTTAEGQKLYKEKGLAEGVCRPCVRGAVRILEEILAPLAAGDPQAAVKANKTG
jgi:C_GCAxxG_C_C family probable redox protein